LVAGPLLDCIVIQSNGAHIGKRDAHTEQDPDPGIGHPDAQFLTRRWRDELRLRMGIVVEVNLRGRAVEHDRQDVAQHRAGNEVALRDGRTRAACSAILFVARDMKGKRGAARRTPLGAKSPERQLVGCGQALMTKFDLIKLPGDEAQIGSVMHSVNFRLRHGVS
jgi:hypothetical protein